MKAYYLLKFIKIHSHKFSLAGTHTHTHKLVMFSAVYLTLNGRTFGPTTFKISRPTSVMAN